MKDLTKKRVMAGSMAVVMTVALAGTCGYENLAYVHAEDAKEAAAKEEKEKLEQTIDDMIGDSDAQTDGVSKEESVYIKADASGNVKSTTVTEWLKNPGNGEVADASDLSGIKNIKGEETFEVGDGNTLSWDAAGEDIYYQGKTDKTAPVGVEITYRLDGKEIAPEKLDGKSGHLEMTIHYINNSMETTTAGGETVEMYTPFTMVTAMMLPVEEYQNVSIDSGKIISDADHDIVVGVGFPGLEENLKLDEADDLDLSLPDTVTVEADVTDASVHPSLTVASTEILEKFDLTDAQDFDSLEDSIREMQDAANALTDGSSDAADGAKELSDGSVTLRDGAKTLAGGVHTLNEKSGDLANGAKTLADGIMEYTGGVDAIAAGAEELVKGASGVNAGAAQVQSGIQTAKQGADQLVAGYNDPQNGAVVAANGLNAGLAKLSQTLGAGTQVSVSAEQQAQIAALANALATKAVENIPDAVFAAMNTTKADYINTLSAAYAQELGIQIGAVANSAANGVMAQVKGSVDQLAGVSNALAQGVTALRDGTVALQSGLGTLEQGSQALVQGTAQLEAGAGTLSEGAGKLHENSSLLTKGVGALNDGGTQLLAGVKTLSDGADQVADGAGKLSDGAAQLSDGNAKLSDGMSQFKTEAVDKLANAFEGDIKNVTSRMEAMVELGQQYRSFAGIKDGMNGTTKFIIVCE